VSAFITKVQNHPKNAGISAKNGCVAKIGEDGREAMHKWFHSWLGMFDIQTAKKRGTAPQKSEAQFFALSFSQTPTTFNLTPPCACKKLVGVVQ
jgi:hypothetical protein